MSIPKLEGKTTGLKPSQLRRLERLFRLKPRPGEIVTAETARTMAGISFETKRQIGLMLDRRGVPHFVLVGDRKGVFIPELSKYRLSPGRLRGLRLIHTHLEPSGLSREDLTDLLLLRLDLILAIEVTRDGLPGKSHLGYLSHGGDNRWAIQSYTGPFALPADPIRLIAAVEEELGRGVRGRTVEGVVRALLVGWSDTPAIHPEDSMEELKELARTDGIEVTGSTFQPRPTPDPRYVVGLGKLKDVAISALDTGADTLIFNGELSPSQLRSIAETTELKVIDRTMLILDIFAQHAKSKGGKIQVELAQLRYLLPRLVGKGTALSRLAGGIGTRGPGETKLETDRRRIRQRIATLEKHLKHLKQGRRTRRKRRGGQPVPTISIVGYTNVGKSTLLNTLTTSSEIAENKLFATLDPVSRRLTLPDRTTCILTDTVGLIHDLPPELKKAFAATFEEIYDADFMLLLTDASHPAMENQIATVNRTLEEMGVQDIPRMTILNKADLVGRETLKNLENRYNAFSISAKDKRSLGPVFQALQERFKDFGRDRGDSQGKTIGTKSR